MERNVKFAFAKKPFPYLECVEDRVPSEVPGPQLREDDDPRESGLLRLGGVVGDEGDRITDAVDVEALSDDLREEIVSFSERLNLVAQVTHSPSAGCP